MRGKPDCTSRNFKAKRITPADAGKTSGLMRLTALRRDHPRRCGENIKEQVTLGIGTGSPPQMRGKPLGWDSSSKTAGITPADAGKTKVSAFQPYHSWDHPRRCGENMPQLEISTGKKGSPPQMRGKRKSLFANSHGSRITPADAGKTLKRSFRNQPFCSRAVQISFNFSNSLNVSLQSGSAR